MDVSQIAQEGYYELTPSFALPNRVTLNSSATIGITVIAKSEEELLESESGPGAESEEQTKNESEGETEDIQE